MRAQIRGLDMASKNSQDAISLVQTAEGGLQEIDNMVQRIRELVVQSANDTNDHTTLDRQKIQGEISQLASEIDSMSERIEFNSKKLINGDLSGASSLHFQVGANRAQSMGLAIAKMDFSALFGVAGGTFAGSINATSGSTISDKLSLVDQALSRVTSERAKLGAVQNRLEYTIKSLDISSENLSASESRIRDTDMAKEMMALTKSNVLQQAATSMLSQANQAPQNVLQLLR
jgi:flagellin